jgi:seryl-tRNA synthetase
MSDYPNYETPEEIAYSYPRDAGPTNPPKPQEQNVDTIQENPAVSKLREAFDTARNAIIEGSELAKQVTELRAVVDTLRSETTSLQRDLEYIRSRNRELDEQVTEVRRQRDSAIADASEQRQRAETAEAATTAMRGMNETQGYNILRLQEQLESVKRERDDAMIMSLEFETKLKAAEAKLEKVHAMFVTLWGSEVASTMVTAPEPKPLPHWEQQPRDEVGKFQPTTYDRGSQSEGSGF